MIRHTAAVIADAHLRCFRLRLAPDIFAFATALSVTVIWPPSARPVRGRTVPGQRA